MSSALARRKPAILVKGRLNSDDLRDGSISTLDRAMVLRTPDALEAAQKLADIAGRPLADRILVLPLPPDERHGTIYIPENSQQDQICGIVVAVGRGRYEGGILVAPEVIPGNFVMFAKFSARTLKIGNLEVLQIVEGDITFAAGK